MIRRLRLENWRAYDALDIEFGPGTTFVVAPNGVGKTSLVEAAAWALFGEYAPPADRPIRAGADSATVQIEVELPDQRVLNVTRHRASKLPRRAPEPVVLVDGAPAASESLPQLLQDQLGADPAFLARVAMPRPHTQPSHLDGGGLTAHLCRLFGVESLLAAAGEADMRVKAQSRLIRAAKQGAKVDQSRLSHLTAAAAEAADRAAAAKANHDKARLELASAEAEERAQAALLAWEESARVYGEALAQAAKRASDLLETEVLPERLQGALAAAVVAAREELGVAARAIGANEAQQTAIEAAAAGLIAADDDCPVCRRPLDDQTAAAAHQAQDRDLERLRRERTALMSEERIAARRIEALAEVSGAAAALPKPGPRPETPVHGTVDVPDLDTARQIESAALSGLVAATAASDNAQHALAAATDDETAHSALVELFAKEAVLLSARATINATAAAFVDRTVRPIADELAPRWSAVLPGRGGLHVTGAGALTRPLEGEDLAFDSFSGGERTLALVLLRLLVVQMTTKASFCWFDEPLEHLDPDARRQVASLLAGAGSSAPLRQVLLTTYEQPLAERLAADSPGRVKVIAVR